MSQKKIDAKYVPIDTISEYDNNPRRNDYAVDAVAASIKQFGWRQPIIVDSDMIIIAGHTRFKAAKALGLTTVPVVMADQLTPREVGKFRLADNKTGELAKWDPALLNQQLDKLSSILSMTQFGFPEKKQPKGSGSNELPPAAEDEDSDIIICPRCKRPFSKKEGQHV